MVRTLNETDMWTITLLEGMREILLFISELTRNGLVMDMCFMRIDFKTIHVLVRELWKYLYIKKYENE